MTFKKPTKTKPRVPYSSALDQDQNKFKFKLKLQNTKGSSVDTTRILGN